MSEPQFAYGGLTLDELRSMAASPQVGAMQAMPQSFRALADRVGEVADLLSHAQADLPNWWKGPAAEQAAGTLGRAAAEAREFHGSALAAASAVSRCAQVVAEQQNQMMNVPEVPEPGITDVVQRPTTPFEALEAARQDATYQAAHEQAVQVVNGIAAQYVETRSQLANVTTMFGENFTSIEGPRPAALTAEGLHESGSQFATPSAARSPQSTEPRYRSSKSSANVGHTISDNDRIPTALKPIDTPTSGLVSHETRSGHALEYAASDPTAIDIPGFHDAPESTLNTKNEVSSAIREPVAVEEVAPTSLFGKYTPTDTLRKTGPEDKSPQGRLITNGRKTQTPTPASAYSANQAARTVDEGSLAGTTESGYLAAVAEGDSPRATPRPAHQSQLDEASSDSAATIPPYSSLGSIHRPREERNPRPAYLKERKSAWLPDTVAAPADGVICLDLFE